MSIRRGSIRSTTAHSIPNGFASLDAAIAWGEFDAVANVTPDSIHHPTTIAALKAGKHVFCEKPLATDATKAFEMTDVAEKAGPHQHGQPHLPQRRAAAEGARDRDHRARSARSSTSRRAISRAGWSSKARGRLAHREPVAVAAVSKKHGSNGVLGDIGVHILDFASYGSALRHRARVRAAQDLRQGAGQQDRRVRSRCQ